MLFPALSNKQHTLHKDRVQADLLVMPKNFPVPKEEQRGHSYCHVLIGNAEGNWEIE
jgi:hypothetical protein